MIRCRICHDDRTYTAAGYATHRRLKHPSAERMVIVRLPLSVADAIAKRAKRRHQSVASWCAKEIERAVRP